MATPTVLIRNIHHGVCKDEGGEGRERGRKRRELVARSYGKLAPMSSPWRRERGRSYDKRRKRKTAKERVPFIQRSRRKRQRQRRGRGRGRDGVRRLARNESFYSPGMREESEVCVFLTG